MKKSYFPLFVDISEKKILVIGGGNIAMRRIETLLEFADNITTVAPKITDRLMKLSQEKQIHWVNDVYREEMLEGSDLVLAATDDEACNEKIVEDCKKRGILVNASHKKELCDFYFPGIIKQGNLVVGFNSSGSSHREVKEAREKIEFMLRQETTSSLHQ